MTILDIFDQYWLAAISSLGIALLLIYLAVHIFPCLNLIDRPHKYGLKRDPIPYYGGLPIFVAFVVSVLIFVPLTKEVIGLLIGSFLVMAIGFIDDRRGLSPFIRLFFQFLGGVILVVSGIYIFSINLPFLGALDFNQWIISGIPMMAALFTIFWVMSILNAMNFVDGISGLNSGVTFIAALTLFILSIHTGIHADPSSQVGVATISLILAMCALAFLIFDFPKPKILMGDTGSTFLGFVLATLAIFSGGKVATAFLVLGIVMLDMVWVILRRFFTGKKIWHGDLKHLHHRIMEVGFSERRVVVMYLILSAIFGISAVILVSTQQKFFILIALVILMLLLAGALIFIPKRR